MGLVLQDRLIFDSKKDYNTTKLKEKILISLYCSQYDDNKGTLTLITLISYGNLLI